MSGARGGVSPLEELSTNPVSRSLFGSPVVKGRLNFGGRNDEGRNDEGAGGVGGAGGGAVGDAVGGAGGGGLNVEGRSSTPVTEPEAPLHGFVVPLKFETVLEISPNFPAIRSVDEGCVKVDNPYLYVRPIDCILEPANELHVALIRALVAERAYDGPSLLAEAPVGLYTWLLYRPRDEPEGVRFVAKQTCSMWELGTRHGAIACDPSLRLLPEAEGGVAGLVFGGGELEKTREFIQFNLLSGTFTKVMVDGLLRKERKTGVDHLGNYSDAVVDKVKKLVHRNLRFVPAVVDGVQAATFLTYRRVGPVSRETLDRYRATGFTIVRATEAECRECEEAEDAKVAKMAANAAPVRSSAAAAPPSPYVGSPPRRKSRKTRRARKQNRRRKTTRRRKF